MATALGPEELSTCSICYGQLINPRKLPGCFHVFCENCLLTYINNIKSNDKDSCELQCPNCRRQIPLPGLTEDLQNWIKSLEGLVTDDTMASNTNTEETDNDTFCISCKDVDLSVPAEKYCVDCEESLCERCSRIRHRTKVLKEHSLFHLKLEKDDRKDDRQGKLIRMLTESLKCNKHPEKAVSHICRDENTLCCSDCLIDNHHRHCDTIDKLENEAIKDESNSKVKQIKNQMEWFASQIKVITDFKKTNVADIKRKSEEITDQLTEIRTKLITVLDAVEENVNLQAKAFVKKVAIESEEETAKLNSSNKKLQEYVAFIDSIENLGSSTKLYIVLEKLTSNMDETRKAILEIAETCAVHEIELKFESILEKLLDVNPNDTDRLVSVTKKVSEHTVPSLKIPVPTGKGTSLEKLAEHAILPTGTDCSAPEYYSIVHLKQAHGKFLVSHCHGFCCSADERYKPTKCFQKENFSGKPFHATSLKNGEIAMSVPEKKKIFFLSEHDKLSGHINTKYKPKALYGLKNGDIAVSWNDPVAFGILCFTSLYTIRFEERAFFQHDKAGRNLRTFDFMAVDEKRSNVIQPCTEDKAVYCFDYEGNSKFKYFHEDLVFPRGVSISGDGNIFVCDEKKSVIHVISSDGYGLHVLREGCPKSPLAIAFDQSGLQFAVSQNCDPWKIIRIFRLV